LIAGADERIDSRGDVSARWYGALFREILIVTGADERCRAFGPVGNTRAGERVGPRSLILVPGAEKIVAARHEIVFTRSNEGIRGPGTI
jgi:hypothetical protein